MITRKINNHPREKRGNKNSSQATIGQAKDVLLKWTPTGRQKEVEFKLVA